MIRSLILSALILTLVLGGCGEVSDEANAGSGAGMTTPLSGSLGDAYDCVRENGGILISAHRGGPVPGYPENAIETFANTLESATPLLEVDVVESQDGVLFLLHDSSLGRTTTGSGSIAETDWSVIKDLYLRDNTGETTRFHPPTLDEALVWAKENGAILQLDKKPQTSYRNIINAVRAADAMENVSLIAYTDNHVFEIQNIDDEILFSATVRSVEHLEALVRKGLDVDRLVAWTGIDEPKPDLWQALLARGIETNFGTLGRPGERLDDVYASDGDLSEFSGLAEDGLIIFATDLPFDVADELAGQREKGLACLRSSERL